MNRCITLCIDLVQLRSICDIAAPGGIADTPDNVEMPTLCISTNAAMPTSFHSLEVDVIGISSSSCSLMQNDSLAIPILQRVTRTQPCRTKNEIKVVTPQVDRYVMQAFRVQDRMTKQLCNVGTIGVQVQKSPVMRALGQARIGDSNS